MCTNDTDSEKTVADRRIVCDGGKYAPPTQCPNRDCASTDFRTLWKIDEHGTPVTDAHGNRIADAHECKHCSRVIPIE